ncbi:MAG: branched-chain amino acid ABC transporter permease [Actinobacteria bacterium 13_2_20CM_2_71_6]|nr:MAG: branched-chain amino acid ABC transporter permease [Actinobacteria bacterium 13_2_20CM_2_71_6]
MTPARRNEILRNAAGVGTAVGAYALSFGALSVAAGLSAVQTMVLSLVMFTGGSQFALVLTLGAGGGWLTAAGSAVMLGSRNLFYGPRVAELLDRPRGWRRLLAAHVTIDETTAMALGQEEKEAARYAFWATAVSVYALWNLGTLVGALGATLLPDPKMLGLDAAAPAAFLALLEPRLRGREPWLVAGAAAVVALLLVPVVPAGVPVIVAALVAVAAGLRGKPVEEPAPLRGSERSEEPT